MEVLFYSPRSRGLVTSRLGRENRQAFFSYIGLRRDNIADITVKYDVRRRGIICSIHTVKERLSLVGMGSRYPLPRQRVCLPHFGPKRGRNSTPLWVRGWGDPIRTTGKKLYTLLSLSHNNRFTVTPPAPPPNNLHHPFRLLILSHSVILIQSMKKTQVCSWIAFCRKTKVKVETAQVWEISRLFPETSTKLYFHEFHLRRLHEWNLHPGGLWCGHPLRCIRTHCHLHAVQVQDLLSNMSNVKCLIHAWTIWDIYEGDDWSFWGHMFPM